MAPSSVPLATFGRHPQTGGELQNMLAPEYDLVHQCFDLAVAKAELPLLFRGDRAILPASGIGSNVSRPEFERRIPRAVLVGGLISDAEFDELQKHVHVELGHDIAWFKLRVEDVIKCLPAGAPMPSPATPPAAETLAKAWREKLALLQ